MLSIDDLNKGLFLIAGPCVIESEDLLHEVAKKLVHIKEKTGATIIFKASYDKANRTSVSGFRGPGLKEGVELLKKIKSEYELPILTDVHSAEEATYAGEHVDIIQIPAFLCRQTDLILAACKTPAWVNIKKGQFLAPWDMKAVIGKAKSEKADKLLLTERGVSFGYNMLVTDFRAIPTLKENGYPVIYDGTHSVQMPGGKGDCSGGDRTQVPVLSRAAVAAGADGLFWETHPDPDKGMSDGPNMLFLDDVEALFETCRQIYQILH
ncbi:MAG: 3-deoxy-8-phosphooctulonate synthase [Planctomycetes bacterium]|nr:3-deoxy-8-phosphooctulonate synthase [Planctomycetota bacterium]